MKLIFRPDHGTVREDVQTDPDSNRKENSYCRGGIEKQHTAPGDAQAGGHGRLQTLADFSVTGPDFLERRLWPVSNSPTNRGCQ